MNWMYFAGFVIEVLSIRLILHFVENRFRSELIVAAACLVLYLTGVFMTYVVIKGV